MLAGVTCLASGCGNVVKDGTEALGEGRYDAAETAFEEATKNENKEVAADGYQGLGMTYYEQKEYDKALEAFQTALDQGAEQTQELYNLTAVCAMKTEDYAKALECFQAGIACASVYSTKVRQSTASVRITSSSSPSRSSVLATYWVPK